MKEVFVYKIIPATVLLGVWLWLAYIGKTDFAPLVDAIKTILLGLGIYHAAKPTSGGDKP